MISFITTHNIKERHNIFVFVFCCCQSHSTNLQYPWWWTLKTSNGITKKTIRDSHRKQIVSQSIFFLNVCHVWPSRPKIVYLSPSVIRTLSLIRFERCEMLFISCIWETFLMETERDNNVYTINLCERKKMKFFFHFFSAIWRPQDREPAKAVVWNYITDYLHIRYIGQRVESNSIDKKKHERDSLHLYEG